MLFAKSNPTKILESFFLLLETPTVNKLANKHIKKHKPQHAKTKTRIFNLQEHKQK
jgi:hypothetical protein